MASIRKIFSTNSSRTYLAAFAKRAADSIPAGARVLDAGAGDCPYRSMFDKAHYESTDICVLEKNYGKISFISDLNNIPAETSSYDLVFCSQTLEHVSEPEIVIKELNRIIKSGGKLWLTVPFFYTEHEIPYDYYRYTQFGLQHLLQKSGFRIESIEWLEGYFGTLAYQLRVAAKELPLQPGAFDSGILRWPVLLLVGLIKVSFAALSIFFTWLDLHAKYVGGGQCKNYAVVAEKMPN